MIPCGLQASAEGAMSEKLRLILLEQRRAWDVLLDDVTLLSTAVGEPTAYSSSRQSLD